MVVTISVRGHERLARLAQDLKAHGDGKALRRKLLAGLRQASKPVVADLKQVIAALPVTGGKVSGTSRTASASLVGRSGVTRRVSITRRAVIRFSAARPETNLRARVAAGAGVTAQLGKRAAVRIVVRGTRLDADEKRLPVLLNREKGWRHPVMGNKNVWVSQQGQTYLWPTVKRHLKEYRAAVNAVLDEIANTIASN